MTARMPGISFPVPANKNGHPFSSAEELLAVLAGESSGLYLVGCQGMWHGGIHITNATVPWCALSTDSEEERKYCRELYKGEQFIRCMADGEIVAWRICESYERAGIDWRNEKLLLSDSFVLIKHYLQPGESTASGLTFYTLYMHLAPYSAYKQPGGSSDRKVAGVQRYYLSADDVQAKRVAGKLEQDTPVTLGDNTVSRSRDQRQFSEVTLKAAVRNAEGEELPAGTRVWTVSDRGSLKAMDSVPVPSWWAKCAPACTAQPEGVVNCTSRTDWAYYLSRDDVLQNNKAGKLAAGFPLSYEPGNTAQQVTRPGGNPNEEARTFSLVTLGRDKDKLKKGDRVWVVSDGDSLTPVVPAASGGEQGFNTVCVPPQPVPVSAGDGLGHMGFYQLPEENGKLSRYQVHIECLSMDDMEKFLTNPGGVGVDTPVYLTWQREAPLYEKGEQGMAAGSRKTRTSGVVTLTKVPGADVQGKILPDNHDAAYFQIRQEGGWLAAASVQKVAQYAPGELGFVTLNQAPENFDLIDGFRRPDNMVKGILEHLYQAAQEETRITHILNKYNYQWLLERIDSNRDGYYSEQEYLQAIHNISYRDHLYRIIVRHASEWYYDKGDALRKNYLDTLTRDAPLWKKYLETFLDRMTWMKALSGKGVSLGPEVWHMHPVVFLEALRDKKGTIHITLDMLYYVFNELNSPAKRLFLQEIADEINNHASEYKLDNILRVNHFFAQIREEMGGTASPVESLNYSEEGLKANFRYFKINPVEAKEYSYTKVNGRITKHANETAIADRVYANRLGNRDISSGDGSTYRGRGGIHLTGKNNYQGFTDYYKEYWGDNVDFINNPSLLEEGIYCVRSAIYFWLREKLYELADQGDTDAIVDKITAKVNLNTNSYAKRRNHFRRIKLNDIFKDAF